MKRQGIAVAAWLAWMLTAAAQTVLPDAAPRSYPLFYDSADLFHKAIASADKSTQPLSQKVTGITVPHHLLAADMIATTFRLASGHQPARIVILSPDHFRRGTTLLSTTTRSFQSPLGAVASDVPAVLMLLDDGLVAESNLFSHEHGVQTLLPFIARFFPDVPVVPLALDIRSTPEEWEKLAAKGAQAPGIPMHETMTWKVSGQADIGGRAGCQVVLRDGFAVLDDG